MGNLKNNIIAKRIVAKSAFKRVAFNNNLLFGNVVMPATITKARGTINKQKTEAKFKADAIINISQVMEDEFGDELIEKLDIGFKDKAKNWLSSFNPFNHDIPDDVKIKAIMANADYFGKMLSGDNEIQLEEHFDMNNDALVQACKDLQDSKQVAIDTGDLDYCRCTGYKTHVSGDTVQLGLKLEFTCACEQDSNEEEKKEETKEDPAKEQTPVDKKHQNALNALKTIMHKAISNQSDDDRTTTFALLLGDVIDQQKIVDAIVDTISENYTAKANVIFRAIQPNIPDNLDKEDCSKVWYVIGIGDKAYRYIFEDKRITDEELDAIQSAVCPGGKIKGLIDRCAKSWCAAFEKSFTLPNSIEEAILDDAFGDEFDDSELTKLVNDTINAM